MTINKYIFYYNDENYITSFATTNDDNYDYKGQMSQYPNATKGWTKFINGQFVEDNNKKQEILAEEAKQKRIVELKDYLNKTDYIYNSIREGGRTEEYYAEVIERRKEARKEIQELEGE